MSTIMVVDDEQMILDAVKRHLTDYEVITALSAEDALEKLTDNVDLIITDIRMPGMNGVDMIKKIFKEYPDLPAIIITGFANGFAKDFALSCDQINYVQKPLDFTYLLDMIETMLDVDTSDVNRVPSLFRKTVFADSIHIATMEDNYATG